METHAYYTQMKGIADRRNLNWYRAHLADTLLVAKEKGARDVNKNIALAQQLEKTSFEVSFDTETSKEVWNNLAWAFDDSGLTCRVGLPVDFTLSSPAPIATPVPPRSIVTSHTEACMLPVEPEVTEILLTTGNKEATQRYLRKRNQKGPEEKYFFRRCSNWDYGWKQGLSQMPARDCNYGRQKIVQMTFYRRNNIAPDSDHYRQPATASNHVCDQDLC